MFIHPSSFLLPPSSFLLPPSSFLLSQLPGDPPGEAHPSGLPRWLIMNIQIPLYAPANPVWGKVNIV